MTVEERLRENNIVLPAFNKAVANYSPAVKSGELIFTAGQTPRVNGALKYTGKVSNDSYEQGIKAAEICILNCLGIIDHYANGLENVARIVKISGFINAEEDFTKHAIVMDGATNLLVKVFGDAGRPARTAVGVSSLPGDATVEVEMIVEVK